jgi:heat shock protein HslJ
MVAVRNLAGLVILMAGFAASAHAASLGGTAWQLVEIASMNDTVDRPDDPSHYTLEFKPDGTALILADCNRGTGSWTAKGESQLQFGPIAATKALCPTGSLSEKYLAQFAWVRSYVMKDDHLFLATMADGSIIEFAPAAPVTGTIYGADIRAADVRELQQAILTPLFDRYANDKGIAVEASALDAYLEKMRRDMEEKGLMAEKDLTPEEATQAETMRRDMARALMGQWQINKSLYERYGGRIIYQQLGPEPLDAYREFLEEQERAGAFTIADPSMEEAFWAYFKDDTRHDFMEPGSEDESRAFTVPPWEEEN